MEKKSWSTLNKDLSWSTKIYILIALLVGFGSFVFQAWATNWALTILIALAVTLLVEHFSVVSHRHPKAWKTLKWTILLIALALLLMSLILFTPLKEG